MGIISFFTRRLFSRDSFLSARLGGGESIYSFIQSNIDPVSGRFSALNLGLPDQGSRDEKGGLKWAPGALDGAFGHHVGQQDGIERINEIASAFELVASTGNEDAKEGLYRLLLDDEILFQLDQIATELGKRSIPTDPHLHAFCQILARRSPDRGPVKVAIALLGLIGDTKDLEMVKTLGYHEEFTLYSAVAISNMLKNRDPELWELAKRVDGWGRIQTVERLAQTKDPKIKAWILREGYRNNVMYEYLAYIAATTGELKAALSKGFVDDELMRSAGEIIEALVIGGPAEGMDDYRDAADAITALLRHVKTREAKPSLDYLLIADSIARYLNNGDWNENDRAQNGWTAEKRSSALQAANEIRQWDSWTKLVKSQLDSRSESEFYAASRAAKILSLNTWDVHWKRLRDQPEEPGRWFDIMQLANDERIAAILELAEETLPLSSIATGPGGEIGLAPEFNAHGCLDFLLQDLNRFPGQGWRLIETGLRSPVIRNRHMALNALQTWNSDQLTAERTDILKITRDLEPNKDVKERLEKLLG